MPYFCVADLKTLALHLALQLWLQIACGFAVQRKGDIGSPREVGSTKSSKAFNRFSSLVVRHLRPPPWRLTRPCVIMSFDVFKLPDSNSRCPILRVLSDIPVYTVLIPPKPRALASAAPHKRRVPSSSSFFRALYLLCIVWITSSFCMI